MSEQRSPAERAAALDISRARDAIVLTLVFGILAFGGGVGMVGGFAPRITVDALGNVVATGNQTAYACGLLIAAAGGVLLSVGTMAVAVALGIRVTRRQT